MARSASVLFDQEPRSAVGQERLKREDERTDPKLTKDQASFFVDDIGDLLPLGDLRLAPDPRSILPTRALPTSDREESDERRQVHSSIKKNERAYGSINVPSERINPNPPRALCL